MSKFTNALAGLMGAAMLTGWALATAADTRAGEIRFGSVAMNVPAEMHRRLTPLTRYLSEALQHPVVLKLAPDMPRAVKDVSSGDVELTYLTPVAYIDAHDNGGAKLVVKTLTNNEGSFQLVIAVREDSAIKTVADLAGRSFAFGDKAALLQRAAVVGAGMPLEKLGDYKFIGHYDNIAQGVVNGDFDAGVLKDTVAMKWKGKGLRVIYSTPPLPPYNIAAAKHVDDATVARLRDALLALNPADPEHAAVIKALDPSYTGFAATSDDEYAVVRDLIKPFKK
jgi:phosphonate transport system substrate-binding protein